MADKRISLPKVEMDKTELIRILSLRRTDRSFATKELSREMIADLLWAAYGINRPDSGKRTAPSAHNWQQVDVYVADANGLYLYNATANTLDVLGTKDIRALTGAANAPLNLIYVVDEAKVSQNLQKDLKTMFSATTVGAISQNVYLFCAAEGLATGVRGDIQRDQLHKAMGLRKSQTIYLAQSVGFSKKGVKQWIKKVLK